MSDTGGWTDGSPLQRVVLKISGEILGGEEGFGLSPRVLQYLAEEIHTLLQHTSLQLALVVGGGNILRGHQAAHLGIDRATADYMGMLGTVINALALQSALESRGIPTRVMTAIEMPAVAEPYVRRRAIRHLEKGRVVIFGCGTGNPFFSTDTAAVLRASEIGAQEVWKGTKVDGVYTRDPMRDPDAQRLSSVTFDDILQQDLRVVDPTAAALCKENGIPMVIFRLMEEGVLLRLARGETVGTRVEREESKGVRHGTG